MTLKKWLVAAMVVLVAAAWTGPTWAQDDEPDQPKVKKVKKNRGQREAKKRPVRHGSPIQAALATMELDEQTKAKADEALKAVAEKQNAEAREFIEKRKGLQAQIKAEQDKEKKKELLKQVREMKWPSADGLYAAEKEALKDILSADQLATLDESVKAAQTESALKGFDGRIAALGKKNVELSDEQTEKVAAERTKLAEALAGLDAGQIMKARMLAGKSVNQLKKNILTEEQRAQVTPQRKPREKKQPKAKKQKPADEEGDAPEGGDDDF